MEPMRTVAVITGSRADFGLLRSVMQAIDEHPTLELQVLAAGAHLLEPARTIQEVEAAFPLAAVIEMQREELTGRLADADAVGRGICGFTEHFARLEPDIALVLGDRIEAFAAAAAASIGGIRVAHVHGGDRAEGVADEAMRHAITKLAHIHLPATTASAERIIAMGEAAERVHVVGSPALDDLDRFAPLGSAPFEALGRPEIIFLLHPSAEPLEQQARQAQLALGLCRRHGRTLALMPNHDPGREAIAHAIAESPGPSVEHLPREQFIGLLKRVRVLVGNSSAGLIEAAALGVASINLGPRQAGRERPEHVVDVPDWSPAAIERALREAASPAPRVHHPYGDGQSGTRIAEVLAGCDFETHGLAKRNRY